MAVRTAMLVAVLGVGVLALYLSTWNMWDWSKLLRRAGLVAVALVAALAGWMYWSSLPPTTPVTEWWGVALGATRSDVRFLKGEPTEIVGESTWVYALDSRRTYRLVFADSGEVVQLLAYPGPGFSSGVSLLGVREGLEEARVLERLGEPTRVVGLADGLRRAYLYDPLNAVFLLERGAVVSFGIYDVGAGVPYADGENAEGSEGGG